MRFRIASVAAVVIAVGAAALAGGLRPLDDALTDSRFALSGRAGSGKIAIVDIDSKTLAAIGRWPLPRRLYGDLIDRLVGLGAAEIAFDIDFSAVSTPEDDAAFEAGLVRAGDSVVLAVFEQPSTADGGEVVANRPIDRFARHAWLASVDVRLDPDGKVRYAGYGAGSASGPVPSLAALYGGGAAPSGQAFRIDFGIDATTIDRLSLIDLLDNQVDRSRIEGKKIIIGAQAVELRDDFLVPRYGLVSGSLLQALAAESVAAGRALSRTNDAATWSGLLLVALLAFFLWYRHWLARLACLGVAALAVEAVAILVQRLAPLEVATGAWQAALLGFGVVALLREIDLRRILVAISRIETANSETILARVIADSYAGVLVFDAGGTVIAASRSAGPILGQADDLVGASEDILPAALMRALAHVHGEAQSGASLAGDRGEIAWQRGGEDVILDFVATPSRLDGGLDRDGRKRSDSHVVALTVMDVTERRRAADRISYLARYDTLTGLANRNHLLDSLDQALARGQGGGRSIALVALDVDRFRTVNDTLGPGVGDRLLVAIADRLRGLADADDVVARLSADVFAVVLAGEDAARRAEALAEQVVAGIKQPYDLDAHRLVAGMSVGIAHVESGETNPLAVMQRAEMALRKAKAAGGTAIDVFDADMASAVAAGQRLEQELWEASRQRQFEVFYQPVVDLATGRIVSSEALLRWRHPVRGYVAASEFVPVLEAIGLMPAIGRWVLETAASEAVAWPANIGVAVNVSQVQFMRGNLLEAVREVLGKTGLSPARLSLEITESLFLQATHTVAATMDAICAMGVRFALDDFGTGYSSLAYVRKFPIAAIKIDRSFVADIPVDEGAVAIVRTISALAESLHMSVVAEGIESIEQVRFLRLLGCTRGQGYLYGAAVPAADFAALVRAGHECRLMESAAAG